MPRSSRQLDHTKTPVDRKEMQTVVVWSCFPFTGLAKTILQGTVKAGRRQGRQKKRWEDNIREWTGLKFGKSQMAVENRENGEYWLQTHLWCHNDPRGCGINDNDDDDDDDDDESILFITLY